MLKNWLLISLATILIGSIIPQNYYGLLFFFHVLGVTIVLGKDNTPSQLSEEVKRKLRKG